MKTVSILLTALFPGALAFSAQSAAPASSNKVAPFEIDSEKAFAESVFPIKPDDLINRAKEVLGPDINIGISDGGRCIADDFEFCAPVVGPIGKDAYLEALEGFKLQDNFDITQNMFGFTVSPVQPYRVYFFSHQTAKQVQPFLGVQPDDTKELILPPQCHHLDFDEEGKVKEFGFYTVDRRYGNTGGLGGAFGYFYGVGKPIPIPECQPYKPSFRFRTLQFINKVFSKKKKED
eukprot:CAMPEP_0195523954 /NCGR_PEP_ID=MMETSP0794_2-20130614/23486_1 /TAXON_ID=515487 /ORGANISM="Stephanopyxis turris, Strain CCMP 815" /LENGTH=233 /DNA_ID=CAMNT_0040654065 /DNA_START=33 /DNA_END=734 /DNA_ORIENTATION=+